MLDSGYRCTCDYCGYSEFQEDDNYPYPDKVPAEIECNLMREGWVIIKRAEPNGSGGFDFTRKLCCNICCKNHSLN